MTSSAVGGRPSVDFMLPGRWWHIALGETEDVAAQVRAMTRSVVGSQDDRARLRRELAQEVSRAASAAAQAHATDFYFAVEVIPGVPIPAFLAIYWPQLPAGLSLLLGPAAASSALAASLRTAQPDAEVVDLGGDEVGVVRSVTTIATSLEAALEAHDGTEARGPGDGRDVVVSYWALRSDAPRPLLLSFTSPLASMKGELVELFDAIVGTVTWTEPTTA